MICGGTLCNDLAFDHPLYGIESESNDDLYLCKVYDILNGGWSDIHPVISDATLKAYEMRKRCNWEGADSIYDAWLLSNMMHHDWFDMEKFNHLFPDWKEVRNKTLEEVKSSGSEENYTVGTQEEVDTEEEEEETAMEKEEDETATGEEEDGTATEEEEDGTATEEEEDGTATEEEEVKETEDEDEEEDHDVFVPISDD